MSEMACCAHLNLRYRTLESSPGHVIESFWQCPDCATCFTITPKERRPCQVSWPGDCLGWATHRAMSTNGEKLTVFQICEAHARATLNLAYDKDQPTGMKKGDPLWVIFPPVFEGRPIDAAIADSGSGRDVKVVPSIGSGTVSWCGLGLK